MMLDRLIKRSQKLRLRVTFWTLALPSVLLLVLGSVAYGLGDIIPQLNFWLLFSISVTSLLFSWIFASTRVQSFPAALISLVLGIPIVLVRAGGLESQLINTFLSYTLNSMK